MKNIADLLKIDFEKFSPKSEAEVLEYERKIQNAEKLERYRKTAPERYWAESFETYKTDTEERRRQAETAKRFTQAARAGKFQTLILLGAAGTGKTHLACAIIREAGGIYKTSAAIAEEFRRAKSFNEKKTEAEILAEYGKINLLAIDEIGRGATEKEEQYALYQIINERYNGRKPTILISNQTKKDFLNYAGIACADRLTESAIAAEFSGESFRAEIRRREKI